MQRRYLGLLFALVLALALVACEEEAADPVEDEPADDPAAEEPETDEEPDADEEPAEDEEEAAADVAGLDCAAIEFIVPYAPGGGSDQQVRRMQPHLEDHFGASINVVYQTGGDGSVAWQSLHDAEPDGCTVANVVSPNISLQTIGLHEEDAGFRVEDFTYLAWTETAPNALAVSPDSEWEDVEQYIADAEANPGGITIAGAAANGQLATMQMEESIGFDLAYVPVEGGVGDVVPQLQGGHVDSVTFGANHVAAAHAESTRALAVFGPERVPALEDVPTFEELGYEGITMATAWGVAAPPDTPDDVVQAWNEALLDAVEQVRGELEEAGLTPLEQTPEEAEEWIAEQHQALEEAEIEE